MWSKKGVVVLCGAVAITFFALLTRSYLLMMAAILLFSYLTVALIPMLLTSLDMIMPYRRMSGEKIFEDGEVVVELDITNKGYRTGFLEVRDKVPKQLKMIEGSNYLILDLKANERRVVRYSIMAPLRGIYPIGHVNLRSQDPYAIYYKEVNIEDVNMLSVFPRVEDVKELEMKAKSLKLYPGAMPVKQPGPGSEFFLIRDYVPGDPFKNINWKAFARRGILLVNEKEREAVSDIVIILDSREVSGYGTDSDNTLIYGARAAATLTNFFLKRRDSVGLVIYGERMLTVKQGQGQKQLYEILTALAGAKSEGNLPFKGVIDVVAPYLPKRSPVIFITSLDGDETIQEGISSLRTLEYSVIVISPSSVEFEMNARARTRLGIRDPLPYDLLKLDRDLVISDIRGYGATVIDWDPKTPLLAILMQTKR